MSSLVRCTGFLLIERLRSGGPEDINSVPVRVDIWAIEGIVFVLVGTMMVLRTTDRRAAAGLNAFEESRFTSIGSARLSCDCPMDGFTTERLAGVGLVASGFFCDGFLLILARRPLSPDATVLPLAGEEAVSTFAKLETEADFPCRVLGID